MNEELMGNCFVCGHEVSKQAKTCPSCGQSSPTNKEVERNLTMTAEEKREKEKQDSKGIVNAFIFIFVVSLIFTIITHC